MAATVWGPVVSVLVIAVANLIAWAANENSWLFKRCLKPLGVRPLLFISNRAACVNKHARPTTYWAFDLLDPSHLVKSNCLSTPVLLVLHALTFLYWVAYVIVDVAIEYYRVWCNDPTCGRRHGGYGEWASFLTNWSISILGIAGLIAFVNTARHLGRERAQRQHQQQQSGQHNAAGVAADSAGQGDERRKVDNGSAALDHDRLRDSQQQQQLSVQHVVPTNEGNVQLACLTQDQQAGTAAAAAAAADDDDDDEPGCCLSPKSRHAKSHAAAHYASSAPAPAGSSSGSAADTVVVVQDAGSSSEVSSSSSNVAGQGDVRQVLKHNWDCLSCTHCIVMGVATTAAFFVSFWYWVGIVSIGNSAFSVNGGTFMAHAGNVVVALLQIVLTRLPIVSYHFQVVLWYASLYCVFLWIFGGASDIWRYGLNFQQPRPAGVFVLLPIIVFVMFLLWFFAARIREGVLLPAERKVADRHHRHKEQRHQKRAQHQQQHSNVVQHAGVQQVAVPAGNAV